ncbi:MAG: hypothetical protein C4519_11375 [Desulfobacteraceae bacterium]|nr:MAG: hypothetical protein C4519_11375 [Desulfobacteraceae bacterium]
MEFSYKNAEELFEAVKNKPVKALLVCFLTFIVLAAGAWAYNFFSEFGKRHDIKLSSPAESSAPQQQKPSVSQQTEGDQSPAIISDGDVKVDYRGKK